MDIARVLPVISVALSFMDAGVGAYFGGYLKTKGENLATHEDIEKLKDQMEVVTRTTEEIKTEISDAAWNRQKHWELKRDVLFEASKRLAETHDALVHLAAVILPESLEQQAKCQQALADLYKASALVGLVCGRDTHEAFMQYGRLSNRLAVQVMKSDDVEGHLKSRNELEAKSFAARASARKELGIEEQK